MKMEPNVKLGRSTVGLLKTKERKMQELRDLLGLELTSMTIRKVQVRSINQSINQSDNWNVECKDDAD